MLVVIEESQENTGILRRIQIHRNHAPTVTSVDRRHTGALNT